MAKRIFRISISFLIAIAICITCLPFFQELIGTADSSKPLSASINGLEKIDGDSLADVIRKTNLLNSPIKSIDVRTGKLSQSDFELLKKDNANIVLSSLIMNDKPISIAGISAFDGCPTNRTVFVLQKYLADYKGVNDGNVDDEKWFGWDIDIANNSTNNPSSGKTILISALSTSTSPGGTCEFFANMQENGLNLTDKTFTWSIEGNVSLTTSINAAGSLKIGEDETAKTITVKAMCENVTGESVITIGQANSEFDSLLNSLLKDETKDEESNITLSVTENGANVYSTTIATKSPLNLFASVKKATPPKKTIQIAGTSQSVSANLVRIDYVWLKDGVNLVADEKIIIKDYNKDDDYKSSLTIKAPEAGIYTVKATAIFNYPDYPENYTKIESSFSCTVTISDKKLIDVLANIDFSRSEYKPDTHPDVFIKPILKIADKSTDTSISSINGEISYTIGTDTYSISNPKDSSNLKPYQISNGKILEPLTFLGENVSSSLPYGNHKITIDFTPKNADDSESIYAPISKTKTFNFVSLDDAKLINTNDILTSTIKKPIVGEKPTIFCDANENYTAKTIWTIGESTVNDTFLPNKIYTANVVFTAKEGYLFATGHENNSKNQTSTPAKISIFTENESEIGEEKYLSIVKKAVNDKPVAIMGAKVITVSIKFARTDNPTAKKQNAIKFVNKLPTELTYGDMEFAVALQGGNGNGIYSIHSSNKKVLAVNDRGDGTAIVQIIGAGNAKIVATKESGEEEINGKNELFNSIQVQSEEIEVAPKLLIARSKNMTIKVGSQVDFIPVSVTGFTNGDSPESLIGYAAPTATSVGYASENLPDNKDKASPSDAINYAPNLGNIGQYDTIVTGGEATPAYKFKYVNSILTVSETGIAQPDDNQIIESPTSSILNIKHGVNIQMPAGNTFETGTSLEVIDEIAKLDSKDKALYDAGISKTFDGRKMLSLYEITLKKDNDVIKPSETLNVTVQIPSEIFNSNRTFAVAYINDNGDVQEVPTTIRGNKMTFETNHFSKYAIVGQTSKVSPNPPTSDKTSIIFITATLLSAIFILTLKKKIRI